MVPLGANMISTGVLEICHVGEAPPTGSPPDQVRSMQAGEGSCTVAAADFVGQRQILYGPVYEDR